MPEGPTAGEAPTGRRPIRPLAALLVNQIAAGEVVERPASVVKELAENAIDAGASRVEIELELGGIELVRVADDGCGIPEGELVLALAAHATSKIERAEDLDRIATMGFRGEAVASIASVSRLTLRSRTREQPGAFVIASEGGDLSPVRPAHGPVGTLVEVRNLFFNTPARRKFLRTPATEQGRCLDVARDLALAHPAVSWLVRADGRVLLDVAATGSPRERALGVLGRELGEQLLDVHADRFDDARGLTLWGLVGRPAIARATAQAQHLFVNGRAVRDRTVQHALKEAFRGLIEPGRHPTAVLMLEMSPQGVDVNVHPQKAEVRFRDSSMVHQTVYRAVREALSRADLTPRVGDERGPGGPPRAILPGEMVEPRGGPGADRAVDRFVEYFQRQAPGAGPSADALRRVLEPGVGAQARGPDDAGAPAAPELVARPAERVLQVHNAYLVTQDDAGVVIIDQHALHERVMFEQLVARVGAGDLESQRLLAPAVVPLSPAQLDRAAELGPLFRRIGVDAVPLGPATLGVHAFPTFLFERGVDPVEFVGELLERAEDEGFAPGDEKALHEVLDMMACKAAVKAGDRMTPAELDSLLQLRDSVERSTSCPHGRPTSVRLTIQQLEKLFHRS